MGRWRSTLVMRGQSHSIRSGLAAAQGGGGQSLGRSQASRVPSTSPPPRNLRLKPLYEGARTIVDVRGGAPGVTGEYGWSHAICLAGGSLYGLEATAGVSAELFARRGYSTAWSDFGLVSGAIIFDYGARTSKIYPDKALGRAALTAAQPGVFPSVAVEPGAPPALGPG